MPVRRQCPPCQTLLHGGPAHHAVPAARTSAHHYLNPQVHLARHTVTLSLATPNLLQVSRRVLATEPPVIVKTKQLMARAPPSKQVLSLAQGIVHWQPPPAALEVAARLMAQGDPSIHGYGPALGLPALTEALQAKVAVTNGLEGVRAAAWCAGAAQL